MSKRRLQRSRSSRRSEAIDAKITERLAVLETDVAWIKNYLEHLDRKLKRMDNKIYTTLVSVVAFGVLAVFLALIA